MGVLSDNDSKLLGMVTDIVSSGRSSPIQTSRIMELIQQEIAKARLDESGHYCDDGHYHDPERDIAMLPSERLEQLKQELEKL